MDKFVIRNKKLPDSSTVLPTESPNVESSTVERIVESSSVDINVDYSTVDGNVGSSRQKRARTETTCESDVIFDPSMRKPINDYDPQVRDNIRREYVVKGPCQPFSHNFPKTIIAKRPRCFQVEWFNKWDWLEYSVSKDAAFCFWCYLFRGDVVKRSGDDVFVKSGFHNWKKACEKFREHVGGVGSAHNEARIAFFAFKDQRQSLTRRMISCSRELNVAYRARLTASVDVVRLLLGQGLALRGHDESKCSLNKGNFLEILDWYSDRNLDVQKVVKENVPNNHKLTSPQIQKEIVSACASETTKVIVSDIGEKFFSILIDEARDSSVKEQMAIIVRYVSNGVVMERFLGVVHVIDTTTLSLKSGVVEFFTKHGLSISKLRGQGYDGASNMRGELNGLKTLILNENPCARYIHCFAHQLQLVVVAVSQSIQFVSDFFEYFSMITNMVGASCKRKDEFRQKQHECMVEKLEKGEIETGRGLNQETTLTRPGATRWGSHYTTIIRLLSLWPSTIQVLENIFHDGTEMKTRGVASSLVEKMESYQFVFIAHLMKVTLGLTNVLSQFLQQKDQNIIEAVSLVQSTKRQLLELRNEGWDKFLQGVNDFCTQNDIAILNMQDKTHGRFRSQRGTTNEHHFHYDIFNEVVDQIGMEMDNRFSESSTELLTCIACLNPKDSFSNFNLPKLLRLTELYPQDFSIYDRMELPEQLQMWISEMRGNEVFSTLLNIGDVAKKMVDVGIHTVFQLVYRLIELVLVLPVATATVERAFSAMNIIKTDLRNKMGDDFLTNCLVCYIEKDVFRNIDNEVIIQHFQNMRTRRLDLPPLHP
ncbi:hypothetical protein RND81_11G117300 [Saponaria officinalis]|uniref:TTF-type domain-containing protein n=1 Tax=Saponaria officinalis TaxID=3572 RepID=A0AAW1HKU4_SAPOF